MRKEILTEAIDNVLNESYSKHGLNFNKEIKAFNCGPDNDTLFDYSYFIDTRGGNGDLQDHRPKFNKVIKTFNSVDEAMSFLSQFKPKYCAAVPKIFFLSYGAYKAANVRKVFEQEYNMYKNCPMNLKPSYHYDWVVNKKMSDQTKFYSVFRVWLGTDEGTYAFGFQDKYVKDLELVHAAFCPINEEHKKMGEDEAKWFFECSVKYDPIRTIYHNADDKKHMPKLFIPLGKSSSLPKEWQNYDYKRVEKEWREFGEVRFFKPTTYFELKN